MRGTDLNAGSRVAMIATHNAEVPTRVRKLALLDVLYPGAKHANRDVIFFFTCHGTGMTPDTSILVQHEAIAHEELWSFFCEITHLINEAISKSDLQRLLLD